MQGIGDRDGSEQFQAKWIRLTVENASKEKSSGFHVSGNAFSRGNLGLDDVSLDKRLIVEHSLKRQRREVEGPVFSIHDQLG
jgi:hypothetical protein